MKPVGMSEGPEPVMRCLGGSAGVPDFGSGNVRERVVECGRGEGMKE